jgi:death-on-curing protein
MKGVSFLTLAEVIEIHADQIERYGGSGGVRDMHLLSSAIATPIASFSGSFLHADIYEMAGAYAFHLCRNHPFFDGNKRTALAAALVFLEINGISVSDPARELYYMMMSITTGKAGKSDLAKIFRKLSG